MASVYFVLSDRFRVDSLLSKISLLPREDRWQTLARMALRYDLYAALAALTAEVLDSTAGSLPPQERVLQWEQSNATSIHRAERAMGEFDESRADLAALSVLLRQIRTLVRTSARRLTRTATRPGRSGPDRPGRVVSGGGCRRPAHAGMVAKTTTLSG